jgi:hypothetical protein
MKPLSITTFKPVEKFFSSISCEKFHSLEHIIGFSKEKIYDHSKPQKHLINHYPASDKKNLCVREGP